MYSVMEQQDKIDLSGVIAHLEGLFFDRMIELGAFPEDERQGVYDAMVAPVLKATNILRSHEDE